MKGRITLSALKSLPRSRGRKRTFLWDDVVRKFGAYRTSNGDVVFVYQFRMHASQPTERLTIGKLGALTPDQARTLAAAAALKVATGINPIKERREALKKREVDESLLLKNFAQYYLKVRVDNRKRKSAKDIRRAIEKDIVPHLGHLELSAIDVHKTEKMLNTLKQRSAGAERSALTQLKAMLNYAHAIDKIDRIPIRILKPNKSKKRTRMLQPREIRRFIEAAHDLGGPRGDAYLCLLRLTKRLAEVAAMRWEEVNLESRMWVLPGDRSKNEDPQTIILPHQVVSILERQQPDIQARLGFVFTLTGATKSTLGTKMKEELDANIHRRMELAAQAGRPMSPMTDYRIHDLRRTGATTLKRKPFKVPPHIVEYLLHHMSSKSDLELRYQLDDGVEEVADALILWNDYLDKLMEDEDSWPGGRHLQPMSKEEKVIRVAALRANWPKTGDKDDDDQDDTD
ncbi:MAG TPA: integrase arm-type DNA-binding domain-containing protein [Allosphingosinicella sp.]